MWETENSNKNKNWNDLKTWIRIRTEIISKRRRDIRIRIENIWRAWTE